MSGRRLIIVAAATLTLLGGGTQIHAAQKGQLPAEVGDLNDAQLVEVRDQSGQVLINGTLKTSSNKPNETEREADLASPTGQKAEGEFEVEVSRKDSGVTKSEIE